VQKFIFEAQLAEKENFLRETMITLEQQKLSIKRELLNLTYDIKKKERTYKQNKILFADKLISQEAYLVSEEDYEFAKKSFAFYTERQKQDSIFRSIQVKQMQYNLENMGKNLALIHERREYLNVKSPVDGQLTFLDAEIGQAIPKGGSLGQIHVLTSYKVMALIDEYYIDKIKQGLKAVVERNGQEFELRIRKIFPDVRNGRFSVEMVFVNNKPQNIRTGQTYYIKLQLGNPGESLLLPRGSFFSETGGKWIYILSDDEKTATKQAIRLGRQNPKYYELIEGLNHGDKVITSSYSLYSNNDKLILE
jgi:HlyD family secretion protein